MNRADRVYDISLRILMLAVSVALIGAIGVLIWRWNQPHAAPAPVVPVTQVEPRPLPQPRADVAAASAAQVLVAPNQVYRCESGGRVEFTDRPCATATR